MNSGIKDLELTLLEWIPDAEEQLERFIKGNWVHVIDFPLIELNTLGKGPLVLPFKPKRRMISAT